MCLGIVVVLLLVVLLLLVWLCSLFVEVVCCLLWVVCLFACLLACLLACSCGCLFVCSFVVCLFAIGCYLFVVVVVFFLCCLLLVRCLLSRPVSPVQANPGEWNPDQQDSQLDGASVLLVVAVVVVVAVAVAAAPAAVVVVVAGGGVGGGGGVGIGIGIVFAISDGVVVVLFACLFPTVPTKNQLTGTDTKTTNNKQQ